MPYRIDRNFTDSRHEDLITRVIYPELGWTQVEGLSDELRELRDCTESIDYEIIDGDSVHIMTQERIRRSNYNNFVDFTIRFERPQNENEIERLSEYYKMKAYCNRHRNVPFYFLYAITADNETYSKYVLVNLQALFAHIRNGEIQIDRSNKSSYIRDGVLYAGVNDNADPSSTFAVFDVVFLEELFNDVIIRNVGFSHECPNCGTGMITIQNRDGGFFLGCPNYRNHN